MTRALLLHHILFSVAFCVAYLHNFPCPIDLRMDIRFQLNKRTIVDFGTWTISNYQFPLAAISSPAISLKVVCPPSPPRRLRADNLHTYFSGRLTHSDGHPLAPTTSGGGRGWMYLDLVSESATSRREKKTLLRFGADVVNKKIIRFSWK